MVTNTLVFDGRVYYISNSDQLMVTNTLVAGLVHARGLLVSYHLVILRSRF